MRLKPILLSSWLVLLAGCTAGGSPDLPDTSAIDVVEIERVFEIGTAELRSGRSAAERRLTEALTDFGGGRLDGVHVVLPDAGSAAIASIRDSLVAAGVNPRKIRTSGPALPPPGTALTVLARRYAVRLPGCAPITPVAVGWGGTPPLEGLGCSTRRGLALMVSDPADLLGNQAIPAVRGDRVTLPVERLGSPPLAPG